MNIYNEKIFALDVTEIIVCSNRHMIMGLLF